MIFDSLEDGLLFVKQFCHEHSLDESTAYKLNLITEELITNLLKHSDAISYELILIKKEYRIYLNINYASQFFDMNIQKPRSSNVQNIEYGGLGLFLIQEMALEFHHKYQKGRNIFEVIL